MDTTTLVTVLEIEKRSTGEIAFAMTEIGSSVIRGYRIDRPSKTASVIKFPLLVHIAMLAQELQIDFSEEIVLTDAEKVAGSGVLTRLSSGISLSIRDLCMLMTVVSDNTATNMLIEQFGVAGFNDRMRNLGLPTTTLFRKSYTEDTEASRPYGLGVTTPREMLQLLETVVQASDSGEAWGQCVMEMLAGQVYRESIPRYLPENWSYAGKTGSVDAVRNDVGIVTTSDGRRFAIALFCQDIPVPKWTADNPGTVALAELARLLLNPL